MSMYDTVHYVYIYVYIYTIAPSAGLFTLLVSLSFFNSLAVDDRPSRWQSCNYNDSNWHLCRDDMKKTRPLIRYWLTVWLRMWKMFHDSDRNLESTVFITRVLTELNSTVDRCGNDTCFCQDLLNQPVICSWKHKVRVTGFHGHQRSAHFLFIWLWFYGYIV